MSFKDTYNYDIKTFGGEPRESAGNEMAFDKIASDYLKGGERYSDKVDIFGNKKDNLELLFKLENSINRNIKEI